MSQTWLFRIVLEISVKVALLERMLCNCVDKNHLKKAIRYRLSRVSPDAWLDESLVSLGIFQRGIASRCFNMEKRFSIQIVGSEL